MTTAHPLVVIAGVGNGSGTGGATARLFAKAGYRVALIARGSEKLQKVADEIAGDVSGAVIATFPVESYSYQALTDVFSAIRAHQWPSGPVELRVGVYNVGAGVRKGFLDVTERDIQTVVDANIHGAFAFSHQLITAFKKNELDTKGKRGTLIFTGATASVRGNVTTSIFSAGKSALRALSQSLNKEFGKENIHVAHSIIDGAILTDWSVSRSGEAAKTWADNPNIRVDPTSIAAGYLYLAEQDSSAWTWELDLRPAHEKW
ncbi:NAD(P)-binding protein [Fomes fomentarius]|nr:NAD(P)-binding protein [Fomes fomentarius]